MLRMSEQTDKLFAALSIAQGQMDDAIKAASVAMSLKNGGNVNYDYAELCDVQAVLKKPFADNWLSYSQFPITTNGVNELVTMIGHKSGQWIQGSMQMDLFTEHEDFKTKETVRKRMKPQEIGSMITYFRRYMLAAAAGVTQKDDDGNAANGNTAMIEKKKIKTLETSEKISFGKFKGKSFQDVGATELEKYIQYIEDESIKNKQQITGDLLLFVKSARSFVASSKTK